MSAPPPPVPARKPGFFHTVKTTVSSVGNREKKTVVGQFEEKRTEFRTLLEDLNRLDSELRTLYDKFSQISQSTVGVWDPLVKQYSSASHHPGGIMATSARSCASNFNEVGMPPARAYLDSAKETVHNLLKECTDLNQEIKTRDNSLSEFDYYSDKYLDLIADRDKTLAKGKSIKPADQEKIDRNLEKRNSSERDYLDRHTIIDTKLVRFLDSRYDNLESVCKNIVEAQHLFATNITGMINDITEKIVKETNIINSIVSPYATNNSNVEVADSNPFARSSQPDATPSAPPVYNPESTPVSNTYYDDSQNSDSTRDYSRPPPMAPRY